MLLQFVVRIKRGTERKAMKEASEKCSLFVGHCICLQDRCFDEFVIEHTDYSPYSPDFTPSETSS